MSRAMNEAMAARRTPPPRTVEEEAAQTQPLVRRVAQVMGVPVSLVLRGRHADDAASRQAWAEVLTSPHEVGAVFGTHRPESWTSHLDGGDVGVLDCPKEAGETLALGEGARAESVGVFGVHRRRFDVTPGLDPGGVVRGRALEHATHPLHTLQASDFCLCGGGDLLCRTLDPGAAPRRIGIGIGIGIEELHETRRLLATVALRTAESPSLGAP